ALKRPPLDAGLQRSRLPDRRPTGAHLGLKRKSWLFGVKRRTPPVFVSSAGCRAVFPSCEQTICNKSWRRCAKAIQFSLNRARPRQFEEADLDEVATRNGDIQASVPDQGHRSPAAGGSLRGRDR